jgi:hypothetical protein
MSSLFWRYPGAVLPFHSILLLGSGIVCAYLIDHDVGKGGGGDLTETSEGRKHLFQLPKIHF